MDIEKEYSNINVNNIRDQIQQISALLNHSIDLADVGLIIDKTDLEQIDLTKLVKEVASVVIPAEINFTCVDKLPIVLGIMRNYTKPIEIFLKMLWFIESPKIYK
jgi:hypothetical protein